MRVNNGELRLGAASLMPFFPKNAFTLAILIQARAHFLYRGVLMGTMPLGIGAVNALEGAFIWRGLGVFVGMYPLPVAPNH